MPLDFAGRRCADPQTTLRACRDLNYPSDWFPRANTFTVSLGEAPGRGWVLLRRGDLDLIDATADHTLTLFDQVGNRHTFTRLTLLGAQTLVPGAPDDPQAVQLCEVVDRRYHLARIPVNSAYNLRHVSTGEMLDESLNAGSPWTWAEVIEDLWDLLDAGTVPSLPFTPDGDPENLVYWGGWAWASVCDVLARIGCAVRYWDDTFTFVRLGSADAPSDAEADRLATRGALTWNSDPTDPARAWRPEKVRVRFARRPVPEDGSSPVYVVDVTLAATTGVETGSVVQLDDDMAAEGASGTPTNSADLTTRAAERAADWLRKRGTGDTPQLIVYRDFQPNAGTLLGSLRSAVAFDERSGSRTTVRSGPGAELERWTPLTGVPKWWPPGGGSADACAELFWPETDQCWLLTVVRVGAGRCSGVTVGQEVILENQDLDADWENVDLDVLITDTADWLTSFSFTADGIPKLVFTEDTPTSPAVVTARYVGCVGGKLRFVAGGADFCDEAAAEPCADNTIVFDLECVACPPPCEEVPNPDYTTAGWYFVDGACVELTEDPMSCVQIGGGPYADEAACDAANPVDDDGCVGNEPPSPLYIAFTGTLAGVTAVVTGNSGSGYSASNPGGAIAGSAGAGINVQLVEFVHLGAGVWEVNVSGVDDDMSNWGGSTTGSAYCGPPFAYVGSGTIIDDAMTPPEGAFGVVVSETP